MKEFLMNCIKKEINKWDKSDIYAISFYEDHLHDNPTKPMVYIGYNTNEQVKNEIEEGNYEELEAKWNYACWIQNELLCFGDDEASMIRLWMEENGLKQLEDDDPELDDIECDEIDEKFMLLLAEVAAELHRTGYIKSQFGHEIPIIIHELEYYETIAEINKKANPEHLIEDFIKFCLGM